jgi:predicted ATPase
VGKWSFKYDREADVLKFGELKIDELRPLTFYRASLFSDKFHYLQAERMGPRRFFETSDFLVRERNQLGPDGRFTAHFLSIFGREDIAITSFNHPDAKSLTLLDQVEAWIGEVSPGTRIQLTPNIDLGLINLQYAFPMGQLYSKNYRSTNVGFGITYTLPILVAVLSSVPGTLILIENPEAHLHPKGQARMGELLALAASSGIQVILETHSDHVLNGIRVAVHDGKLDPDAVQLHYFQRRFEDGCSSVVSPRIDRDGRIDQWPDGFFDEWDKSLEALL